MIGIKDLVALFEQIFGRKSIPPSAIGLGFGSIIDATKLPVEFLDSQHPLFSSVRTFFLLPESDIIYYEGLSKNQVSSDSTLSLAQVTYPAERVAHRAYREAVRKLTKNAPVGLATTKNGRVEYKPFKGVGEDGARLVVILYHYSGS